MNTSSQVRKVAFSPAEAATALGVCRATIYRLLQAGELRSYKVGSLTKIPVSDVLRLVGEQ